MKNQKGFAPVVVILIIILLGGGTYAVVNRAVLKSYFEKGDKPTESNRTELEDKFEDGDIPTEEKSVGGDKPTASQFNTLIDSSLNIKTNKNIENQSSSENSSDEVFKNQPGAVKSITVKGSNQWTLAVDLLSSNPKWLPGVDSTGGFFINQNTIIRNLRVDANTKTWNCATSYADGRYETPSIQNNPTYIANMEDRMKRSTAEFGYTAYFDITGTAITAIYEQCLP